MAKLSERQKQDIVERKLKIVELLEQGQACLNRGNYAMAQEYLRQVQALGQRLHEDYPEGSPEFPPVRSLNEN